MQGLAIMSPSSWLAYPPKAHNILSSLTSDLEWKRNFVGWFFVIGAGTGWSRLDAGRETRGLVLFISTSSTEGDVWMDGFKTLSVLS